MNFYLNKNIDLFPNVDPQNTLEKFVQFPLIRMLIVVIFLIPFPVIITVTQNFLTSALDKTSALYLGYLLDVILIFGLIFTYKVYTKTVENREAHEFSFTKILPEIGAGALLAFAVITFFVLVNYILGYYNIDEFNSFGNVVFMFFLQFKVGFIEELLFRVIIFKLTEEIFGSWIAVAFQGILFGLAHAGNPNASLFTTLALIVSFTIFFGAGYMITRRIWFIFGFHWCWNFFQSGIFGLPNSGNIQPGLITPIVEGPIWITGGNWGAELSAISVFFLFAVGLYLVKLAVNKNQFVKPMWRR